MKFVVKRDGVPVPRKAQIASLFYLLLLTLAVSWTHLSWHSRTNCSQPVNHSRPKEGDRKLLTSALTTPQEETCSEPAVVNKDLLGKWGCKLLKDSCLDQGRILIHTGEKTPGHPKYTDKPLFTFDKIAAPIALPGYIEALGTTHYRPVDEFALDIRAPTLLDPPDVWQPTSFNNCTVPLIFVPQYLSVYAELWFKRLPALSAMSAEGLFDRNVLFTLNSNGMDPPAFYQAMLEPFSKHKVESLASLSSRQRMSEGRSRCYSQLLLCNKVFGAPNYKTVAKWIADYYKEKSPDIFQQPADDTTFRVAVMNRNAWPQWSIRQILNLEELLKECQQWQPPQESRFKAVECFLQKDFTSETTAEDIAAMQRVHALVSLHGSGASNGFFLPAGSALVEILCWSFCSKWPDVYFKNAFESDQSINSGYFRIVADKEHCSPGDFQLKKTGTAITYNRDQHIRVEFATLAKALTKIALGQVKSTTDNFADRVFRMTEYEACPWDKPTKENTQPEEIAKT